MELFSAITGRRSVRRYLARGVPAELVMKMLDAARHAPSADNEQPWEFVVTRDPEKKKRIARGGLYAGFVADADVVVVVCARVRPRGQTGAAHLRDFFHLQDTAAAVQNMLLAAYGLGLGTCWVGDFDPADLGELLRIPSGCVPVAVIAVGYPAGWPQAPSRRPLEEIVHFETF